jgi:hypothetical protein
MATNTTRLGLIKPDFVDVVDISELNTNADDIDAAVGAAVVTSSTRPGAPWLGQIIHETDTDKTLVWDGIAWVEAGGAEDLDDLGDVDITSAESGDTLVYDGADWTNQPLTTRRNLLYNGAMQVDQRGASTASITTAGYYTADRWKLDKLNLGTWTQSVENDAPTGSGFRKSFKMECTTAAAAPAAADNLSVTQILEGQDLQLIAKGTSAARQLTMSFWVKANVTGTYIAELYDIDNTRQASAAYSISASATWQKKTITFAADTTGAFDDNNASSLAVVWWLAAGSNFTSGALNTTWNSVTLANRAVGQTNLAAATSNYWQITGAQVEVGPVATPFEFKLFGQELLECQRYFQLLTLQGTRYITTAVYLYAQLIPPMRAVPALTTPSLTNAVNVLGVGTETATGFAEQDMSQTNAGALFTGLPSGTIGIPTKSSAPIAVSAEL